jgi:MarR family transcriptional regulator, organic hydroperoxide resistance regulator
MRLMWEVDHELHSVSKRMEATIGLTAPQRLALRLIGQQPGLSAGELASLLHLHPGTLTGVMSRLERGGFIVQTRAPEDGRRMRLTLTPRGLAANRRRSGTVESAVRKTLARLSSTERAAAERLLRLLASALAQLSSLRPARSMRTRKTKTAAQPSVLRTAKVSNKI